MSGGFSKATVGKCPILLNFVGIGRVYFGCFWCETGAVKNDLKARALGWAF
jgi:hypothetical protein